MIYNHITNFKGVNYLKDLLNISINNAECGKLGRKIFGVHIVKENDNNNNNNNNNNNCIIDKARRRDNELFKEALKIKNHV